MPRKAKTVSDLSQMAEYQRLTSKRQKWCASYVQHFLETGAFDSTAATESAYDCLSAESARTMGIEMRSNKSIAEVLQKFFGSSVLWKHPKRKKIERKKIKMSEPITGGWSFRLAEPKDAEAFAQWSMNRLIDPKDREAGTKKKNPTCLYFAVEYNGKVVSFAPLYCQMVLPFLVFNPDSTAADRKQSLDVMMNGVSAFAVQLGIREIVTLSKERYPVARWALSHGFDLDPRQSLKLDLNKIMEAEAASPVAAAVPEVQAA